MHKLVLLAACVSWLLFAESALAKRDGQNMPCNVCHEGMDPPKVVVAFGAPTVAPGQSVSISVTATHPSALVGGVFVDSLGKGELRLIDALKTRLMQPTQATHSQPHPYASGQVQFSFDWVAPVEAGVTKFEVWSNAANNNLVQHDDSPQHIVTFMAHGCEGVWYYPDADGDGFGDQARGELSCEPIPLLTTQGGDCSDGSATARPGLVEICNNLDDNCDGMLDEGFSPSRHFLDADGDGYGALNGLTTIGCSPISGYAPKTGDCDDKNAGISPGALELPNGIDDDCDNQTDEKDPPPGTTPGTTPGTSQPPATGAPASAEAGSGGCRVGAATARPPAWTVGAFGLALAWIFRRRLAR